MSSGALVPDATMALPFEFEMGGAAFTEVTPSLEGQLVFDGALVLVRVKAIGPGSTGHTTSMIRHRVVGRFPSRGLVWDWGQTQLVLLEQRDEAIVHLGLEADDGGRGAQFGAGSGVTWSCASADFAGRSAWISNAEARSVAHLRSTAWLGQAWWGAMQPHSLVSQLRRVT